MQFCPLATRGRQRLMNVSWASSLSILPFQALRGSHSHIDAQETEEGCRLFSIPRMLLHALSTEEKAVCSPPQGSSVLHPGKRERRGAWPSLPPPDSALNVDPHSPAQVWNSASSPLGCFSASDLGLLLIPGSPPLDRVPKPHLVTCSIVV